MRRLGRYLWAMGLFLACVGAVAVPLFPAISTAFQANPGFNGVILAVLAFGILVTFRQTLALSGEIDWIETVRAERPRVSHQRPPRLLAPLARILGEDGTRRIGLSALAMRSLLDGVAARLEESREVARYLIGLLIFLGLLGTFWGLLQTVESVGGVVGSLSLGGEDPQEMFRTLQQGLEGPLAGMGTAFSSSLFGLAGSLVLGFLDLQAGQAQNRFFNDLEDWLAGLARVPTAGLPAGEGGEGQISAYLQALIAQTAENLEDLRHMVAVGEESRRQGNASLVALAERLAALTDQMRAEQSLMMRLAESQLDVRRLLEHLDEALRAGNFGVDAATRQHIRNIDVFLGRLVQDQAEGRIQTVQDIRQEIKILTRTIAAIAEAEAQR